MARPLALEEARDEFEVRGRRRSAMARRELERFMRAAYSPTQLF